MRVEQLLRLIDQYEKTGDQIGPDQALAKQELAQLKRPVRLGGQELSDEDLRVVGCKSKIENLIVVFDFLCFIAQHPSIASKSRKEQLDIFFEAQDEAAFTRHEKLQVALYRQLSKERYLLDFNEKLTSERNPTGIIAIGKIYLFEPIKFYAFLTYLLEKGVSKEDIIHSGLFDFFIQNNYPFLGDNGVKRNERSAIVELYLLLENDSDPKIKALFQDLQKTIFTFGGETTLTHILFRMEKIESPSERKFATPIVMPGSDQSVARALQPIQFTDDENNILALYQCFGFDLIKLLDFTNNAHKKALSIIIVSLTTQEDLNNFFHMLSTFILNESSKVAQAEKIMEETASCIKDHAALQQIIEQNPFLLHLLSFMPENRFLLDAVWLKTQVEKLLNQSTLSFIGIHFLVKFCSLLKPIISTYREIIETVATKILSRLMEIAMNSVSALTSTYGIPDDLIKELTANDLGNSIDQHASRKLVTLKENLKNSIAANNPFSVVESIYIKQLPIVNLLKNFHKIKFNEYPLSTHHLKTMFITERWNQCADKSAFSIDSTLNDTLSERILHDSDVNQINGEKKRILLESLVYTTDNRLLDLLIIELSNAPYNIQHWAEEKFGDEKSLLSKAIEIGNNTLFDRILVNVKLTDRDFDAYYVSENIFYQAVLANNQYAVLKFIEKYTIKLNKISSAITQAAWNNQEKMVRFLLPLITDEHSKSYCFEEIISGSASSGNLQLLKDTLNSVDASKKKNLVSNALIILGYVPNSHTAIAEYLCNLPADQSPTPESIAETLKECGKSGCIEIAKFLCSLHSVGSRMISVALEKAIKHGQVEMIIFFGTMTEEGKKPERSIFLKAIYEAGVNNRFDIVRTFINLSSDIHENQSVLLETVQTAKSNGKWELVLSLVKLRGECRLEKKHIESLLMTALEANPPHWEFIKGLCALQTDNKPSVSVINVVLEKAGNFAEMSVLQAIQNMSGDNRPSDADISNAITTALNFGKKRLLLDAMLNVTDDATYTKITTELKALGFPKWYEEKLDGENITEKAIKQANRDVRKNTVFHIILMNLITDPNIFLSQDTISKAMEHAALHRDWDITKQLLKMSADDTSISTVFFYASQDEQWNLVLDIARTAANKLSPHHISLVFRAALECDREKTPQWAVAIELATLFSSKISKNDLAVAHQNAIKSHSWDAIIALTNLPGINSEKLFRDAFCEAISCNDFANADRFISHDPNSHDFNVVLAHLFEKAVNTNDIPLCQYLCDKAKSITLKDFVLETPLFWANTFKRVEIAEMLNTLQTLQKNQGTFPNRAGMFGGSTTLSKHSTPAAESEPKKPGSAS